jgi:secreted trypsin-like serine protease
MISSRHVLVAAHTVGGESSRFRVVGLNQAPIEVSKVTIHPDYLYRIARKSPDHWNVDIAVLELRESSQIEPAQLPQTWIIEGNGCFCGFGKGNRRSPGTPLSRPIKFEPVGFENLYLAKDFLMTSGDSGGGLMVEESSGGKVVVAIAVGSKDNSPEPSYSLLLSVYSHKNWIREQLK